METLFSSDTQAMPGRGLLNMKKESMDPIKLASMLMQSPTPQTVQKIVSQLHAAKLPDADKWMQVLSHYANDPKTLVTIAQEVMRNASPDQGGIASAGCVENVE